MYSYSLSESSTFRICANIQEIHCNIPFYRGFIGFIIFIRQALLPSASLGTIAQAKIQQDLATNRTHCSWGKDARTFSKLLPITDGLTHGHYSCFLSLPFFKAELLTIPKSLRLFGHSNGKEVVRSECQQCP